MSRDVLIVDDEADIRGLMAEILSDEGYATRQAGNSDEALSEIGLRLPSLIVLDIWLQGSKMGGMEILKTIRRDHPELPIVMISGHGTISNAVNAIKLGAYDYIEKPFKTDRLLHVVQRAVEASKLARENKELRQRAGPEDQLIGECAAMQQIRTVIEKVGPTGSRILITGSAGAGKEVAARTLHARSARVNGPFVVLNAATLAPERVEFELFGTEEMTKEGARRRTGVFELAHDGTLLLDEVADMPLETQGKILRVLVEQKFEPVGGQSKVEVDVRVISSSSKDLREEIAAGNFREDLYHRLNVVPLNIPPLSQRLEDIPLLVDHFMQRFARGLGRGPRQLSDDALAALRAHNWPGNVRQLRNIIERLLILAPGAAEDKITIEMLPPEISSPTPNVMRQDGGDEVMSLPLRHARELFEREYLIAQINRFGGNISKTADFVGMDRTALHRKLKSLGVSNRDVSAA